jgi:hypothetical protein
MNEVLDALDAAAEAGDDRITRDFSGPRVSNDRRTAAVKNTIVRFLENLPEDLTVNEIRRELERSP